MPNSEDHAQKGAYRTVVGPSNRPPFGRRRERKLSSFAFPVKVLPPLFVGFDSVEALVVSLPEATRASHEAEIRRVVALGLPPAVSLRTLSTLFGVSAEFVGAISRAPSRYYRVFKIKKGKKTRTIQAPKVALKLLQAWFAHHVAAAIQLPNCVYGFVPGRSGVKEAAQHHCPASWVYSLDIRNFFPSITEEQVRVGLVKIGYANSTASFLSRLLTLDGVLPQGSPASPVISNIVFGPTDDQLVALAEELGVRYTRYADDLVFSGGNAPPPALQDRAKSIMSDAGWVIADGKEHLAQLPARLKVHGLLVHGDRPRLTKGYRNRIRAFKHLLAAEKISAADLPKIRGHLSYSQFIDKE
jgi:RNA-directed DNA polymerase